MKQTNKPTNKQKQTLDQKNPKQLNSKKQHQKLVQWVWGGGNTTMWANLYAMVAVYKTEANFPCFHTSRYGHITAYIRIYCGFYAYIKIIPTLWESRRTARILEIWVTKLTASHWLMLKIRQHPKLVSTLTKKLNDNKNTLKKAKMCLCFQTTYICTYLGPNR